MDDSPVDDVPGEKLCEYPIAVLFDDWKGTAMNWL
jgi:hypothetical protein